MKNKSSIKEFKDVLKFTIVKAQKSLILLECFDYGLIMEFIKELIDCKNITKEQIRVWHKASMTETDIDEKMPRMTIKEKEIQEIMELSLSDSILMFTEYSNRYKLLVARISDDIVKNDITKTKPNTGQLIPVLQEFAYKNIAKEKKQTILLISSNHLELSGLEHICERLTLPLPDKDDIQDVLGYSLQKDEKGNVTGIHEEKENHDFPFAPDFRQKKFFEQHYKELIDSLYGMHLYDIKELLRTIMSESRYHQIQYNFENGVILTKRVKEVKKQMVKNSGLLEVIDYDKDYHTKVGDIDNLITHLNREKEIINNQDFLKSKLPNPRGVLLVGAPGCGKSVSAIATASILELDLYRLNIGNLLGHKYGQSENQFNEALRTAEASAPCVLWIDEIEKAFAGAGNESENDDTLTHIVGHFLTWMQEHETMVYLVATANDVSRMKPEMLRKGRWDEIFYLVYPGENGINKIVDACIKKYELDKMEGFKELLPQNSKMVHMSGSAIESIIINIAKDYLTGKSKKEIEKKIGEYIEYGKNDSSYQEYQNKIKNEYQKQGYKPASIL